MFLLLMSSVVQAAYMLFKNKMNWAVRFLQKYLIFDLTMSEIK